MELPGEDRGGDPSPRPGMIERERAAVAVVQMLRLTSGFSLFY